MPSLRRYTATKICLIATITFCSVSFSGIIHAESCYPNYTVCGDDTESQSCSDLCCSGESRAVGGDSDALECAPSS